MCQTTNQEEFKLQVVLPNFGAMIPMNTDEYAIDSYLSLLQKSSEKQWTSTQTMVEQIDFRTARLRSELAGWTHVATMMIFNVEDPSK